MVVLELTIKNLFENFALRIAVWNIIYIFVLVFCHGL